MRLNFKLPRDRVMLNDMDFDSKIKLLRKTSAFLNDLWGADKVYKTLVCSLRVSWMCGVSDGSRMTRHRRRLRQKCQAPELVGQLQLAHYYGKRKGVSDRYWLTASPAAASALSQARFPIRFWGSLDATLELIACWKDASASKGNVVDVALRQLTALLLLIYHPCEHAVWLDNIVPGFLSTERKRKLERGSSWASFGASLLMLIRSYRRHRELTDSMAVARSQLAGQCNRERQAAPVAEAQQPLASTMMSDIAAAAPLPSTPTHASASAVSVEDVTAATELRDQLCRLQEQHSVLLVKATKEICDAIGGFQFAVLSQLPGRSMNDGVLNALGLWSALVGGWLKWRGMPAVESYSA